MGAVRARVSASRAVSEVHKCVGQCLIRAARAVLDKRRKKTKNHFYLAVFEKKQRGIAVVGSIGVCECGV